MVLTARLSVFPGGGSALRRQLVGAAAGSLVLNASSKLLMLLASILLARWLGATGYGIYASAMAVLLLLGVPTALGLPTLVVRLLAKYHVQQEWGLMRGLLVRANQLVFALAVLFGGLGAAVVWFLGERLAPAHAHALWWAMALLPVVTLGALRSAALRGLHHVVVGQLPESLLAPGLFVALCTFWSFFASGASSPFTPEVAMGLRFAGAAVAFAVGTWLLLRRLPPEMQSVAPRYDLRRWARAAGPLLFLGGMSILNTQTDVLMLAALRGPESAAVYQAAVRGAELVAFSLVVVNMAIQPTISRLHAAGETRQLQRIVTAAARGTLALALPPAMILALFAEPILGAVFGQEFEHGALALAVLCTAQLVNASAGPVVLILNMTGHERDAAVGVAVGAALNVVLNAMLIPLWDINGAAVATAVSLAAWSILLALIVQRRLQLASTALGSFDSWWRRKSVRRLSNASSC